MIQYSWSLRAIPDSIRESVLDRITELVNDGFGLCVSVGCPCAIGIDDPPIHVLQGLEGIRTHSGPRWKTVATWLGNGTVRVDVYVDGPVYGREVAAAENRLASLSYPIFTHRSGEGI